MIEFEIFTNPQPQPRHRHRTIGKFVSTYDPARKAKQEFAEQCREYAPDEPLTKPIRIEIEFFIKRPSCHYGTGKNADKVKCSSPLEHTTKPDLDNMYKFVTDALNGIFYVDDSQICEARIMKIYSQIPSIHVFMDEIL